MIESLRVKDFQSHSDTLVEFAPGVTALVGPSFAGKSAILRCLWWVLTNRIRGENFIGNWRKAKYAFGTVKLDGHKISRRRGSGQNWFRFDGRLLKAPGRSAPEPVAELVNLGLVNYQKQIDPPLWFTESAAEVSRRLNAIINLKSIDIALASAAKKVRKAKAVVEVTAHRVGAIRQQCTDGQWTIEYHKKVSRLECLDRDRALLAPESTLLHSRLLGVVRAAQTYRNASAAASAAGNAIRLANRSRAIDREAAAIRSLVVQHARLGALAGLVAPDPTRLVTLREQALDAANGIRKLSGLWLGLTNSDWEIKDCQEKIEAIETKLKQYKGVCPKCGQPILYLSRHKSETCI